MCKIGARRHPGETDFIHAIRSNMLRVRPNAFPFAPRGRKEQKQKIL